MKHTAWIGIALLTATLPLARADDAPPIAELLPVPHHAVSYLHHGQEVARWHAAKDYPRPFYYPLAGPSGVSLTRMGHPGAPDHDHHQSAWFAHHDVDGTSYWANSSKAVIREKQWLAMEDGTEESLHATLLGWYDEDGNEAMEQELITASRPLENGEHELEIQFTLRPSAGKESVMLGKTNFGLFAVRVSKHLSAQFGGGELTSSTGEKGEANLFGQAFAWLDYSGRVPVRSEGTARWVAEGIAYMDHTSNPRHPSHWHVRDDGWMCASYTFEKEQVITAETPLTLRYLLYAHRDHAPTEKIETRFAAFSARPNLVVSLEKKNHRHYLVRRASPAQP